MNLTVVVPVYNEAHTIEAIVERICSNPCVYEVIIVDDHSTDSPYELA